MSGTAADLIRHAESEIGYREGMRNANKFAAEVLHANNQPWCATFLAAMAKRAGVPLPSTSPYTPSMFRGFVNAGQAFGRVEVPLPGDFVFFDFPDTVRRIQHVGLVTGVTSTGSLRTVEGNTSPGIGGSQVNGGGVYSRVRPIRYVVGYGRPPYKREKDSSMTEPPIYKAKSRVQSFVPVIISNAVVGYYVVTVDGEVFGFGAAPYFGRVDTTEIP